MVARSRRPAAPSILPKCGWAIAPPAHLPLTRLEGAGMTCEWLIHGWLWNDFGMTSGWMNLKGHQDDFGMTFRTAFWVFVTKAVETAVATVESNYIDISLWNKGIPVAIKWPSLHHQKHQRQQKTRLVSPWVSRSNFQFNGKEKIWDACIAGALQVEKLSRLQQRHNVFRYFLKKNLDS